MIQALSGTSPYFFQDLPLWKQLREDDNQLASAFDYNCQIKPYFQPLKCFVDDDVLDLRCRDERGCIAREIVW